MQNLVFLAFPVAVALEPLAYVYHYPSTNGDWLGKRVPDHLLDTMSGRRLAEVASLRGDVALTTVAGSTTQGNGQTKDTCNAPLTCRSVEHTYDRVMALQNRELRVL